jgi:hypothetical protein
MTNHSLKRLVVIKQHLLNSSNEPLYTVTLEAQLTL